MNVMKRDWSKAGIEPSLAEIAADPIVRMVMRRHGQSADELRRMLAPARRAVRRRSGWRAKLRRLRRSGAGAAGRNPWCRLSRICEGIVPLAGTTAAIVTLVLLARLQGW